MKEKSLHNKIISHKLEVVYLRIPKNASSAIREKMFELDPNCEYKRTRKRYGYFHFTVVRHPFERIMSTYLEKICRKDKEEAMKFINNHDGLYYKMPFLEFIEYVRNHDDPHWLEQWKFLNAVPCQMVYIYEYDIIGWDRNYFKLFKDLNIKNVSTNLSLINRTKIINRDLEYAHNILKEKYEKDCYYYGYVW